MGLPSSLTITDDTGHSVDYVQAPAASPVVDEAASAAAQAGVDASEPVAPVLSDGSTAEVPPAVAGSTSVTVDAGVTTVSAPSAADLAADLEALHNAGDLTDAQYADVQGQIAADPSATSFSTSA